MSGAHESFARNWTHVAVTVVSSLAAFAASGSVAWQKFISKPGGFIAYYHSDWHTFPPPNAPALNVYNFPFSRSGGGVLPAGGASIAILTAPEGVRSQQQWIDLNGKLESELSKEAIFLRRTPSGNPLAVTQIVASSRIDSSSDQFESVACYFEIRRKLFVARLTYWKGDPRAEEYRKTLHNMIQRIRLLNEE
jgi:hypothetical protein